jgi:VIT1/CCC1 family predicted Fe2+/Mn2+ transporter
VTLAKWLTAPENRLDVVAGLIDGILTALAFAAGELIEGSGATLSLAVRVAIATGLANAFVFFFAHYAELRTDLLGYEKQLNFLSHGKLAASNLGKEALSQSFVAAAIAAVWTIFGAALALAICVWLPEPRWAGPAIDILLLGGLGILLARSLHGAWWKWALSLIAGGLLLTVAGIELHVAG